MEIYSTGGSGCITRTYSSDTATYPETIVYPNGRYRIFFGREQRTDYPAGWLSDNTHHSFERSRLKNIYVQYAPVGSSFVDPTIYNSQTIRRYKFTYESDPAKAIFPGHTYSAGGKVSTLISVQEFRPNGLSLPPHTFSYADKLHLTQAANGYGGVVEFDYDDNTSQVLYQPWSYG